MGARSSSCEAGDGGGCRRKRMIVCRAWTWLDGAVGLEGRQPVAEAFACEMDAPAYATPHAEALCVGELRDRDQGLGILLRVEQEEQAGIRTSSALRNSANVDPRLVFPLSMTW